MTIQDRRYFILKHNAEQEEAERAASQNSNGKSVKSNGDLNAFARITQMNMNGGK